MHMYLACHLLKDAFIIRVLLFCFFIYLKDNAYTVYICMHLDICRCHMLPTLQPILCSILSQGYILKEENTSKCNTKILMYLRNEVHVGGNYNLIIRHD